MAEAIAYYTGIGSRETPPEAMDTLRKLGEVMAKAKYILRSGGAEGADTGFEEGCDKVNPELKQIFLPWNNFNGRTKNQLGMFLNYDSVINAKSEAIAAKIHPAWDRLSQGARKLHARNTFQILGPSLDSPSTVILYWALTNNRGEVQGGTRTAVKLAEQYKIPCFNLNNNTDRERLSIILEIDI